MKLFFLVFLLFSCDVFETGKDPVYFSRERQKNTQNQKKVESSLPSFESLNEAVFKTSCVACHGDNSKRRAKYHDYAAAKAAAATGLARMNDEKEPMPPKKNHKQFPPVSDKLKMSVKLWIDLEFPKTDQEALEKIKKLSQGGDNPAPKVVRASYESLEKEIFQGSCVTCHGDTDPEDGIKLNSFNEVKKNAQRSLVRVLSDDKPMPPVGKAPHPSVIAQQELKVWICLDYPRTNTDLDSLEANEQQKVKDCRFPKDDGAKVIQASFESLNDEVFKSSCVRCHGDTNPEEGIKLNSYSDVVKNAPRSIERIFSNEDPMPPKGEEAHPSLLAQQELKVWMCLGYPETNAQLAELEKNEKERVKDCRFPKPQIPNVVQASYESLDIEIFQKSCVKCHGDKEPEDGIKLNSLVEVKKNAQRSLERVLSDEEPMPPLGEAPHPTTTAQQELKVWICLDYPETNSDLENLEKNDKQRVKDCRFPKKEEPPKPVPTSAVPSYESLSQSLFQVSCIACHGENSNNKIKFNSYQLVKDGVEKAIKKIEDPDDPMPPLDERDKYPEVSGNLLNSLKLWIDLEFPNSDIEALKKISDIVNEEEELPVVAAYDSLSIHLFELSCNKCHGENGRRKEKLHNYGGAKKYAEDSLYRIQDLDDPMPPEDKAPHPTKIVEDALTDWICLNYPKTVADFNGIDPKERERCETEREKGKE